MDDYSKFIDFQKDYPIKIKHNYENYTISICTSSPVPNHRYDLNNKYKTFQVLNEYLIS